MSRLQRRPVLPSLARVLNLQLQELKCQLQTKKVPYTSYKVVGITWPSKSYVTLLLSHADSLRQALNAIRL